MTKKGFDIVNRSEHCYFYLKTPDGKHTTVRTKMSRHGNLKDIDDSIIAVMRKQLHFDTKNEMMKFIDCTKSYEEYIAILEGQGII
jgi:hypothetical protein